jgi:DNA-binding transcriptional regulator YbjK
VAFPTPRSRRAPKQDRSREIVSAIVAAGRELLARDGPASLTTNRIAERAGVSIGSLYRYFADKDAILAPSTTPIRAARSRRSARPTGGRSTPRRSRKPSR